MPRVAVTLPRGVLVELDGRRLVLEARSVADLRRCAFVLRTAAGYCETQRAAADVAQDAIWWALARFETFARWTAGGTRGDLLAAIEEHQAMLAELDEALALAEPAP